MSALRTFVSRAFGRLGESHLVQACLIAVVTVAAVQALGGVPIVDKAVRSGEEWSRDLRLPIGNLFRRAARPNPDIVVISITESVLDAFPYRSPVDRQFLSDLLNTLAAKHVRAIGVDVLFDRPTEPEKDEALRRTLRTVPVPVVASFVDDPRLMEPEPLKFLKDFVPPESRGMANIVTGDDNIVRAIYPGERQPDGSYIPGLDRAILGRLGLPMWAKVAGGLGVMAVIWVGGFVAYGLTELFVPLIQPTIVLAGASWLTDLFIGRQMRK
jgi:hypothetical protein